MYEICAKAGPQGENSDIYRYINSPIPEHVKSVDDPQYKSRANLTLELAEVVARASGKKVCIKLYF